MKGMCCAMKNEYRTPKIGEVYMTMFEGSGNEQSGWRPALIFQNNTGNTHSPNVIVLPLTSKLKKVNQPTHVVIRASESGLVKDSMVLCENPTSISKNRLGKYLTTLPSEYMCMIARAHMLATSAIAFIDPNMIQSILEQSLRLNADSHATYA